MKVFDIAFKDMLRSFRSAFAVGMMLVAPLLQTGLIYAAFGGLLNQSENQEMSIPVIAVQVVNRDLGAPAGDLNAGDMLVDLFNDDRLQSIFAVSVAEDEAAARAAVDRQEAAAALFIPADFTRAALTPGKQAQITVYEDPALTFGPGLVREVVDQFLDGFSGGQIAASALREQFAAQGHAPDSALEQQIMTGYGIWLQSISSAQGLDLPVDIAPPARDAAPESTGSDQRTSFLGPVMVGMMILFVFFGAALTAQTIVTEQEEGTLARMLTTPTPAAVILGGKLAAVFLTLIVQTLVLIALSALVFGINWGNPLTILLASVGMVISAAGFGVLLLSFIKTSRQAGPVIGGVVTFTAMLSGLMTTGLPSVPSFFEMTGLALPQGWALRAFRLALSGAAPHEVIVPLLVMLAFGIIFFMAGARVFRARFV